MVGDKIIRVKTQYNLEAFNTQVEIDVHKAINTLYNMAQTPTYSEIVKIRRFLRKLGKEKIYRHNGLDWCDIQFLKLDLLALIHLNSGAKSLPEDIKDEKEFIDEIKKIKDQIDEVLGEDSKSPETFKKGLRRKKIEKVIDNFFEDLCFIIKRSSDRDQDIKEKRRISLISLAFIGRIMKKYKLILKDPMRFAEELGSLEGLKNDVDGLMGKSDHELKEMIDQESQEDKK